MYLWSPQAIPPYGTIIPDGGYDNGIIVHEYTHGVSTRLTGGPSSNTCLFYGEHLGEGWSDYFALMFTTDWNSAVEDDHRGIGTYVLGEDTDGPGIRAYPYTTDMDENPMTYDYIKNSFGSVHYIGTVWASMLWDMTWKIIEKEGIDPDIYFGTGGNNIAMQLVMEGMKLQPCNPGFVDARDAILQADVLLYEGAHQCDIWEAFAGRGLGVSADQGASYFIQDGTQAFDIPSEVILRQKDADSIITEADIVDLTYEIFCQCQDQENVDVRIIPSSGFTAYPDTSYSLVGDTIHFEDLNVLCGDTSLLNISLELECLSSYDSMTLYRDSIEGEDQLEPKLIAGSFINWSKQTSYYNSPNTAWYAEDINTTNLSLLEFKDSIVISGKTFLSFYHRYETEYFWDGGFVQFQFLGDSIWHDAQNLFIKNGYPAGRGFSGTSADDLGPGFVESTIDFSPLIGSTIRVGFLFYCDVSVGGSGINGWYIDDIKLTQESGEATHSLVIIDADTSKAFHDSYYTISWG